MEATGVYWKPVWHMLEGEFERKSDVNDVTWIADLLAHGLIRASLVPPGPIQELRDLTRTRKQLMREIGPAQTAHSEGARRRQCEIGFSGVGRVW